MEHIGGDQPAPDTAPPADSTTPFAAQRRRRMLVLALVIGGGCLTIVGMRLHSGGPTAAIADDGASNAISAYLAPPSAEQKVSPPPTDPLSILARCAQPPNHIPVESLKSNPFLLPGGLSALPVVTSRTSQEDLREARRIHMQQQLESMRVSLVLQGRHSVAVVGNVTLPLDHTIEYDADLHLTLLAIAPQSVRVEASDPLSEATIQVDLPRP